LANDMTRKLTLVMNPVRDKLKDIAGQLRANRWTRQGTCRFGRG